MSDMLVNDPAYALDRAAGVEAVASRPITVLHMFKYFRPDFTGDGIYFEKLIPLLAQQGIRSEITAETTCATAGDGRNTPAGARFFGGSRWNAFNPMLLLWFLVNAWRYDVVHVHSAIDRHFLYHMIARLFGCRVVHSCTLDDGLGSLVGGYRARYRGVVRMLCGLIDDVVAISPRLYHDSLTVAPTQTHFIPQGVVLPRHDPVQDAAARDRFGFAPQDVVALFVGGLCPRKDVRYLVENMPHDVAALKLLLVGPTLDEEYVTGLRAAIAASPAADRITLAGFMDDPGPAYRAADMFVFASHKEGCPNVLLEAMAHGLPVISRHLGGTTDSVIDHGASGILFGTPEQFKMAIRRLAGDRDERTAMGHAARAIVSAGYDMHAIAARYSALYAKAR